MLSKCYLLFIITTTLLMIFSMKVISAVDENIEDSINNNETQINLTTTTIIDSLISNNNKTNRTIRQLIGDSNKFNTSETNKTIEVSARGYPRSQLNVLCKTEIIYN
jgi:hypothetical protein